VRESAYQLIPQSNSCRLAEVSALAGFEALLLGRTAASPDFSPVVWKKAVPRHNMFWINRLCRHTRTAL
jgi:hypothetical protein